MQFDTYMVAKLFKQSQLKIYNVQQAFLLTVFTYSERNQNEVNLKVKL